VRSRPVPSEQPIEGTERPSPRFGHRGPLGRRGGIGRCLRIAERPLQRGGVGPAVALVRRVVIGRYRRTCTMRRPLAAMVVRPPRRDESWMSSRYVRFDRPPFLRLLTADPPVCRGGRPLEVLANCDRLRRGDPCWCRFEAEAIVEDLEAIGAPALSDWLTDTLEPEDVEAFADEIERAINGARPRSEDDDAVQRVAHWHVRLRRLVRAGAGLTDRYSDDLD